MTMARSPTCLNAAYDPSANPALTGTAFTVTARSVRGIPMRKTSPGCIWPDLPSACSTAFQSGSAASATAGVLMIRTRPRTTIAWFDLRDLMATLSLFTSRPPSAVPVVVGGATTSSASSLLLQHRVEPVKDRHSSLEQFLILLGARREASDGEIHARGLVAGELAVVQVGLVHDLGHDPHAPVLDPEPLDQRLERAVLAVVPEVGAQDIERDALPRGVGRIRESEFRIRIVEALDEPGGGDAVDVRPRSRHPRAPARGQRRAMSPPGCPRSCLCGAQACGRGLPELPGPRAGRRVQIVDRLDAVQLALEAIQLAAQLRDRPGMVRPIAVQLGEDLAAALHDRLVLDATRLVEERLHLRFGHGLDPVDVDQGGLTAERLNFLHEPLEELRRLRGLRQDPGRAAEPDGAHALELAPHSDAVAGRRGRKAREEHQPPHGGASVTLDTGLVKRYTARDRPRRITDWNGSRRHSACPSASSSDTICGSVSSALAGPSRSAARWSGSSSRSAAGSRRTRCARASPSASPSQAPSPSRWAFGFRTSAAASGVRGPAGGGFSCRNLFTLPPSAAATF